MVKVTPKRCRILKEGFHTKHPTIDCHSVHKNTTPTNCSRARRTARSALNKTDRSFLRKFQFDYMVVDEGHTLKNPKGLRYKNLNKFKTKHRLLLTGTPCQNNAKELMSLLCFLMPLFDRKSKKRRGHDDDDDDDGGERMLEYFVQIESSSKGGGNDGDAKRPARART